MIKFNLNGKNKTFAGDENLSLLKYLRQIEGITSVKEGCFGQGACGACLVEVNQRPVLSCLVPMKRLNNAKIITIEGFNPQIRKALGRAFVKTGALQCGFCTPGFLSASKILLEKNPDPNEDEIVEALKLNLCRCTGYIKIVEGVLLAARALKEKKEIDLPYNGVIGEDHCKYMGYERATGKTLFIDDIKIDGLLYSALRFSDHPRAKIIDIDISKAENLAGVVKIFTAKDIPGKRNTGVIENDWPLMIKQGEITRYIGDVLAGVVAETEETAKKAAALIEVKYEILQPLTDMLKAEKSDIKIHAEGNLLSKTVIKRGDNADKVIKGSSYNAEAIYTTQMVEHGFIETEAAIAIPLENGKIELHVQTQGVYDDRESVAEILGIEEEKVRIILEPTGGAFGGKEDITVQGHAALFSFILKKPVKLRLSREDSIRMHPKRHPMHLKYTVSCDSKGMLTALKARITGDTGAYASLGKEVLVRSAMHATGAYYIPNVDIISKAVYTNNIPCGAMRGFGVNQAAFAIDSIIDILCDKGGFDRWQFRYNNALAIGKKTASGQTLKSGVGIKDALLAVKKDFYSAKYAGIGCAIKNVGIGNGICDECEVKIHITEHGSIAIYHGWTDMGQGIDTIAVQLVCHELKIKDPDIINSIKVKVDTHYKAYAGMTTASRGTAILGNAIIKATEKLKQDMKTKTLKELKGRVYSGRWSFKESTPILKDGETVSHFAYSFAAHLVILDDSGNIDKIIAAHDSGKVINPVMFEGQVQGGVMMGLGYALTEELPMANGYLKTYKMSKLGIPRIKDMKNITVKSVETKDHVCPHGAKGVGEISTIPIVAAMGNALYQFDGIRRFALPFKKGGTSGVS